MKEVFLSITISNFSSQSYYSAIYANQAPFQKFHQEITKDPEAQVGEWQAGTNADEYMRTCKFSMALAVPQMIKKAIGVDAVSVVETQRLTWHGTGGGFTVTSEPSLNFPGSQKFVTKGEILVSNTLQGGCQVSFTMFCSASMPWPMQSSVEQAMASEAEKSLIQFLGFCQSLCDASKAFQLHAPPTAHLPNPAAASGALPPTLPSLAASQPMHMPPTAREESFADLASFSGDTFYDADQTGAVLQQLQQLHEQLREVNSHLAAIRGMSGPIFQSLPTGSSSSGRLWVLLGVAASASAAVLYVKSWQRAGS